MRWLLCRKVKRKLEDYIDNQLDKNQIIEIKDHLEKCNDCRRELELSKVCLKDLHSLSIIDHPLPSFEFIRNQVENTVTEKYQIQPIRKLSIATVTFVGIFVFALGFFIYLNPLDKNAPSRINTTQILRERFQSHPGTNPAVSHIPQSNGNTGKSHNSNTEDNTERKANIDKTNGHISSPKMVMMGAPKQKHIIPVEPDKNQDAISKYTEFITLEPNNSNAWYNRGRAYSEKGDIDHAISDYTKAIEIDPQFAEAYYYRSKAYMSKGNSDKADVDYNKALTIDPNISMENQ